MNYIHIDFIPHSQQRYDTCGDWQFHNGGLHILVSDTGNWAANQLIAVHELIEALMCESEGITDEQVDAFDRNFKGDGEPGDDPKAPYYDEHQLATIVEKMLSTWLHMPWKDYETILSRLSRD